MGKKSAKIILLPLILAGVVLSFGVGSGYAQSSPLAVLQFQNLTSNPELTWIGEGLPIYIEDKLSRLPTLSVVKRENLQQYVESGILTKLTAADAQEAKDTGQKLDCRLVIWGSYRQSSKIQPVINLSDVSSGEVLKTWSGEFALEELFDFQQTLLKNILAELQIDLSEEQKGVIYGIDTRNLEAYKHYTKAYLMLIDERTEPALDSVKNALKLDPDYGAAVLLQIRINEERNNWEGIPALYQKYEDLLTLRKDEAALLAFYDKLINLYVNDKQYNLALRYCQKNLDLIQQKNDLPGIAQLYTRIAVIRAETREQDNAIGYYQKAMDIYKKLGNQREMGNTYLSMGDVFSAKGLDVTALKHYQKALEIWRVLNSKEDLGITYNKIGQIYLARQEYPTAKKYLNMAIEIQQTINNQTQLGIIYGNLGKLNQIQLNYDQALDYYQKAMDIQEHENNLSELVSICENMATIYMRRRQLDKALLVYQRALKLQDELGQKKQMAVTYARLGEISYEKQNYGGALEYLEKAREYGQLAGEHSDLDNLYLTLGHAYQAKGELDPALKNYQKNLEIQRVRKNEPGQMEAFYYICQIYEKLNQPEKAINYLERAVYLAGKLNDAHLNSYHNYLNQLKQKTPSSPVVYPENSGGTKPEGIAPLSDPVMEEDSLKSAVHLQ